jgi:hypothetical protein
MSIDGFRGAGGIGGVLIGSGSLTITNSKALNTHLNNSRSDYYVDPFLFGGQPDYKFTGTYISENNYVWEGMLINGKTVAEWLRETYREEKYGDGNGGVIIGPMPGDPDVPDDPGVPGDPGDDGGGTPEDPGDPQVPSAPSNPQIPGIGPPATSDPTPEGAETPVADRSASESGNTTDNRVVEVTTEQQVVPEVETPLSDTVTASEVALTPIPLGLGFQTVANAVLTLVVGFVALGILILGGFAFWRMYRRRID